MFKRIRFSHWRWMTGAGLLLCLVPRPALSHLLSESSICPVLSCHTEEQTG